MVELGEGEPPPIPLALVAQARLSARNRINLDTVLRRYIAGSNLLRDYLVSESVEGGPFPHADLASLLRSHSVLLERVLAIVSDEYLRETTEQVDSSNARLAKRVQQLLAGEQIEIPEVAYDFGAHHLGVVAEGTVTNYAIRGLGAALNCRTMVVRPTEKTVWAWFGSSSPLDRVQLDSILTQNWDAGVPLATGELGAGPSGWRLTHQQAGAAFPIALRRSAKVRYADVALLVSLVQDELLSTSLRDLYLAPLSNSRDGGAVLRETLRAYFATGRNSSSTAAALGVSRQTVTNRLRLIERRIARPLIECGADLEAALMIDEIGDLISWTAESNPKSQFH